MLCVNLLNDQICLSIITPNVMFVKAYNHVLQVCAARLHIGVCFYVKK